MAVPRAPSPPDYGSAAPAVAWATGGPPCPPAAISCSDRALWLRVIRHARCTSSSLDPDQWFPVSAEVDKARQEAAAAITVCTTCPVRAECLALSLRHWDIGQHGVWGGLVAAERAVLPRRRHTTVLGTSPGTPFTDGANPGLAFITRQRTAEMVDGARDHAAAAAVPTP